MQNVSRLVWTLAGLAIIGAGGIIVFSYAQSERSSEPRFAEERVPIDFDAKRAMGYLKQICEIGPRISGSDGMAKQQALLQKHFEKAGAKVEFQRFDARQNSQPRPVRMVNLIARWYPDRTRRILIGAHYDTRPIADQEPDPRRWREPFLGANDGASGPALMMELAHHLGQLEPSVGVDFVLFDGEEYIWEPRRGDFGGDRYFFGSEHFARDYTQRLRKNSKEPRYVAAVVIDMIAGRDAQFYYEQYSVARAGPLAERIWKIAADVGADAFVPKIGEEIMDDHLALQRADIPAIDIVPRLSDYPHWHRLTDVPANCSGDTMAQVGRVLAVWMQRAP